MWMLRNLSYMPGKLPSATYRHGYPMNSYIKIVYFGKVEQLIVKWQHLAKTNYMIFFFWLYIFIEIHI